MKYTLKESKAAELICNNYHKAHRDWDYEEVIDEITEMLIFDWGLKEGKRLSDVIDPDTTINEVVEYICRDILGQKEGPFSVSCDLFDAFFEVEIKLVKEDEDYMDEAADEWCDRMILASHGY